MFGGAFIYIYRIQTNRMNGKICLIAVWFCASILLEPLSAAYIIYHLQVYPDPRLLHDLMFEILPYWPWVYNYYSTVMLAVIALPCLYLAYKDKDFRYNIFVTIGTVFLFRDLSIVITNLPLTLHDLNDPKCINYSMLSFNNILKHTYFGYECADYFFSGHMLFYTLGFIAMYKIFKKYILIIMIPWFISCMLALLIARIHYSIDIVHSVFITTMVYNFVTPLMIKKLDEIFGEIDPGEIV